MGKEKFVKWQNICKIGKLENLDVGKSLTYAGKKLIFLFFDFSLEVEYFYVHVYSMCIFFLFHNTSIVTMSARHMCLNFTSFF